jgi:hypothetical protein
MERGGQEDRQLIKCLLICLGSKMPFEAEKFDKNFQHTGMLLAHLMPSTEV